MSQLRAGVYARPMPSTEWRETVAPDEDERFGRHARTLREVQAASARDGRPARALHAKGLVGATAELEILGDLPAHARHGIFAAPATYRGWARFSNGAPRRQHDKKGDVRGLALKLVGVDGDKVLSGAVEPRTQDFLAIQSSATPFRDPDEFVAFVRAAASPATLLFKLGFAIGFGRTFTILRRLAGGEATKPVSSLAATRFFSALPIQVGPYAARYAFTPRQAAGGAASGADADYLGKDIAERVREGALVWDMQLQFFEDEGTTPIEDASVDWASPYVTAGTLTLPRQDVTSEEGREVAAKIERLAFDPWHARAEHKPLGAMMRARKHAYYESTQGRDVLPEPTEP